MSPELISALVGALTVGLPLALAVIKLRPDLLRNKAEIEKTKAETAEAYANSAKTDAEVDMAKLDIVSRVSDQLEKALMDSIEKKQEINDLRSRIMDMEQKQAQMETTIKRMEAERAKDNETIQAATRVREALESKINAYRDTVAHLELKVTSLEVENNQLKARLGKGEN